MLWSTPEVKQLNKEKIRKEIQNSGECTKAEIARKTSLSIVTCNTLLNEMLQEEEIILAEQEEVRSGRPGRPASQYVYNKDYIHVLGIYVDVHMTEFKLEYIVADAFGSERKHEELYQDTMTYEFIESIIEKVLKEDSKIKRISFGIPGVTDQDVVEECDVKFLIGINIRKSIKEKFGLEADVRNDMDFISYGIYNNESMHSGNLATLFFPEEDGNYVGAGFVIDGKVLHGFSHYSGELSCVAEGFGLSRKRQNEMLHDREEFCELVSKMVMIVIGTIDPEKIVVMGNDIKQKEILQVWELCNEVVSEKHIPDLSVDNNIGQNYLNGLVKNALDKVQFPISLRI